MSPANIEKKRNTSSARHETMPESPDDPGFANPNDADHDSSSSLVSTTAQTGAPASTAPTQEPSAKPLRKPRGRRPMSDAQKAALARGREKRKAIMAERAKEREAERRKRREAFLAEQRERRRMQEQERRKAAEVRADRKWAQKRAKKEYVKEVANEPKPEAVRPDDDTDDIEEDDDSQYTEESVSVTLGSQDSPGYKPKYHTSQIAKFDEQYIPTKLPLRRSYHHDIEPRPTIKQPTSQPQLPTLNFL